jgi:hypothetical protein
MTHIEEQPSQEISEDFASELHPKNDVHKSVQEDTSKDEDLKSHVMENKLYKVGSRSKPVLNQKVKISNPEFENSDG